MDNHRWVQEWTDHKYLQPHVFDDVKAQIPPGTLDESASFQKRKAQCEKCNFRKTAFCHVHNKECSLEDPAFGRRQAWISLLGVGTKTPVSQNAVIDS